jgi:hypothetical protein
MYRPGDESVAEKAHEYHKAIMEGQVKEIRSLFDHREAPPDVDLLGPRFPAGLPAGGVWAGVGVDGPRRDRRRDLGPAERPLGLSALLAQPGGRRLRCLGAGKGGSCADATLRLVDDDAVTLGTAGSSRCSARPTRCSTPSWPTR